MDQPEAARPRDTVPVKIEDEMRGAYLDYAMSVIIGRALPDVRDGLKPVHRRVLFAMHDLGNTHDKAYKKSARIVGDVIGKYHPHGDTAVYDALVRMAQDFSLRNPLIDGQGNFGSIDGDSPAAMRYTEVRMAKITDFMLQDLEKDTVDFVPNYDDTLKEPHVLPAKFPNLLVNGSTGIAVGMATNIPPHNLTEIIDATVALIKKPDTGLDEILNIVKGPDFPTSGQILGSAGIRQAYRTGRGVVIIRGRAEIETVSDRERVVITELPYNVNKARLLERIADLVREKKLEGISDLRDESDRTGMRVVIDVKRGESGNIILNNLYKQTQLQDSFGINLLAIHENRPKFFNLKEILWAFVDHRKDVVLRRTAFDLRKAREKAHILEGLKKAVENLDAVIQLIKQAANPSQAKTELSSRFGFTDLQAQAILDMRLQRLTGLEREKIIEDYKKVVQLIAELKKILSDEKLVFEIIEKELLEVREQHGDERKTEIVAMEASDFELEDLLDDQDTIITLSHKGFIKRLDPSEFRVQARGGKGMTATPKAEDEDFTQMIFQTTLLSSVLFLTNLGRMYLVKAHKVPQGSRQARGRSVINLVPLSSGEKVVAVLTIKEFKDNEFIVFVTKQGIIKRTPLSQFKNIRTAGIFAMTVEKDDQLVSARVSDGKHHILICTKDAVAIRFSEADCRAMGRAAKGTIGIRLYEGDQVVGAEVVSAEGASNFDLLSVTENGYGKRTPIEEYRVQSRGGKGIFVAKASDRNGNIVCCHQVKPSDELMLVSSLGKMIRMKVDGISQLGRVAQGVKLMNLNEGEKVVAVERIADLPAD